MSDPEGRWQAFIDYSNTYSRCFSNPKWRVENGVEEDEIGSIEEAAFDIVRLSGYENDLYTQLLKPSDGWTKQKIHTHTRDTSGKDYDRTEVLWMNSAFAHARSIGKVPITLTKSETEQNKVNPSR